MSAVQIILFSTPPFGATRLGPNWLAMVIYDHSRFWIEQSPHGRMLRYYLRSLHGMAFFFGLAGDGLAGGLKFDAGAFAWLYGMNILLALVWVPSGIRKTVVSS